MDRSEDYLDQLDAQLAKLPEDFYAMTVSELDGYVTGVWLCPEEIPQDEWIVQVWGDEVSADFVPSAELVAAVAGHSQAVAKAMSAEGLTAPVYEMDAESGEIVWEGWIEGFTRALRLRPDAWQNVVENTDEETRSAMLFLMALQDISEGEADFSDEEAEQIDAEAPDMIPDCVATIAAYTRS